MRIRISSPPYHSGSGGIKVLHRLGYLATLLGHRVDMISAVLNPEWGAYHAPFEGEPDLSIIPEINPASTPGNVVRWVLYFPGALSGPAVYPDHELVVSFQDEYLEAARLAAPGRKVEEFFLAAVELPGIEDPVPRGPGSCYWQGKGPREIPPGGIEQEITRGWPASRRDLVRLLKSCRTLYSCDQHTAVNQEGQLCGCDVFVWNGEHFALWYDTFAYEFIAIEKVQLEETARFLAICAEHFGVRA